MANFNFTPFPRLETVRLVLRQLQANDENEIFLLRSDQRVNKYLVRQKANGPEDARNFIHKMSGSVSRNETLYWAISLKNDPALIGAILYWNLSAEESRAEIGYEILPDFEGKGFMQEAIARVIEYGFEKMELKTIEAYLDPENQRSVKLLEKNNFKRDRAADEKEIVYVLKREGEEG
jgi:ribosomal-protein-alanine N-acetyltransferase